MGSFFNFAPPMKTLSIPLRIWICFICLLSIHQEANSQTDTQIAPGQWSIGMNIHKGFIIAHRPAMVHLQKQFSTELEISYLKTVEGSKAWHSEYNFPQYGLGYKYFDFGNREELGQGHSLFGQVVYPLIRKNRLRMGAKVGVGVGYVEKPFNVSDNYKNLAIGTRLNGFVNAGIRFQFLTRKNFQINAGIDFAHFSNGSFRKPNLGINLPSLNFGGIYYCGEPLVGKKPTNEILKRNHEFTATLAIAVKEVYPPNGDKYAVNILHIQYHHPLHRKGFIGGGIEGTIDRSLPFQLEEKAAGHSYFANTIRSGIFGSAGLRMGNWDGYFQMGMYTYNRYKEDGNIYNRLLLRYAITKRTFASFGLKSHFGKADYFEWGLGIKF
jgi:Lipid A 3-O-deacylase (PagL)